jgi:mannitol-1-/sugar-/sorbitol-6-/2-deoxyglucose-6-phosphatase
MREIEAVIFDMDGVLVDSEPLWREVEREVFARVGLQLTDEHMAETVGVRIDGVVDHWYRRHPWDGPSREEIAEAIVDGMQRAVEDRGVLREGVVQAIDRFAGLGLRLAVASSSPKRLIRAVLAVGGLTDRFDVVHSAEDEVRGKPDPAVYITTAARLGVSPDRCLAIEDSVRGILAARAAGMVSVAIPERPPKGGSFAGADTVLGSVADLDDRIWTATGTRPVVRG